MPRHRPDRQPKRRGQAPKPPGPLPAVPSQKETAPDPEARLRTWPLAAGALVGALVLFFALEVDVALGWNAGEMEGWTCPLELALPASGRGARPTVRNVSRLSVFRFDRPLGRPYVFSQVVPGRYEPLADASRIRGVPGYVNHLPSPLLPGEVLSLQSQAPRWLPCRIHYAGLFRPVVYDFEQLAPPSLPAISRSP